VAGAAQAQEARVSGAGPRAGLSFTPDQFVVGGQLQVGPFARNIIFAPGLDLGFGDNVTTVQFNFDVDYHFDIHQRWNPYAGGGLNVTYGSFDIGPGFDSVSHTEAGVNFIGGARFPMSNGSNLEAELRIMVGDPPVPDLKIMAAYNFSL
jgi:opacity protein-like surface antigen